MADRVYLYDTTLRDGAQTQGVDFSVPDKIAIAEALDALALDYIEGGWPGANPTDDRFFAHPPAFAHARLTAFGMTRRADTSAANDPGLGALLGAGTPAVCIVGKSWDYHVRVALQISEEENRAMIRESIAEIARRGAEPHFDAEHFFDGYKANPQHALGAVKAAYEGGARWIVLCDTNGGCLPHEITRIVSDVLHHIPGERLGIHTHNDTESAVANSLAAVQAGARLVQGTINGLGERCGNANLISVIPALALKMGFDIGETANRLDQLTKVSRTLDERLNRPPARQQPYVGESAFAHKGGLHASAVAREPDTYEHIRPEVVGNRRHVVVSDQAGRSNLLARLKAASIEVDPKDPRLGRLVTQVKELEAEGYAYDGAEASFDLLARRALEAVPRYFQLDQFHVTVANRINARGDRVTVSEAVVKLWIGLEDRRMSVGEGIGPVAALDEALRAVLQPAYPELAQLELNDFKVRILNPDAAVEAVTRVIVEWHEEQTGARWSTVGVSANVIEASYRAIEDALTYFLFHRRVPGATLPTGLAAAQ